jgi:hypothetical protein
LSRGVDRYREIEVEDKETGFAIDAGLLAEECRVRHSQQVMVGFPGCF